MWGAGRVRTGPPRAVVVAVALGVALSGCTTSLPSDVKPDKSATAKLDQQTGEIIMPLSEYDLLDTAHDIAILNHASNIFLGSCMAEQGQTYTAAQLDGEYDRVVDDRQYGIWFEPNARAYGFGWAPSAIDEATLADSTAGGEGWQNAYAACANPALADPELSKFMPNPDELQNSIVPTVRTDAYRLASADPDWQKAREKWWDCLRDAGLQPLTGATDWGAENDNSTETGPDGTPRYTEASIKAASVEAQCNNQTGLAQTLGNLEASYQAPLIEKNQAALNEWKSKKQERLATAQAYITAHG